MVDLTPHDVSLEELLQRQAIEREEQLGWMHTFLTHLRPYSTDQTPIVAYPNIAIHHDGWPGSVYGPLVQTLGWRGRHLHDWYAWEWYRIADAVELADLYGREGQRWYNRLPQSRHYAWTGDQMHHAWRIYKARQQRSVALYLDPRVPRVLTPEEQRKKEHNKRKRRAQQLTHRRPRKRQKTDTSTTPVVRDRILPKELVRLVLAYL
jgi:hypothetical protein